MSSSEKIEVENVNHPGHITRVDAEKYAAMKRALLKVLPKRSPGLTYREMAAAALEHLPETLFPGGKTAGWWVKTVQLDLEAKDVLVRTSQKPLTWHRT